MIEPLFDTVTLTIPDGMDGQRLDRALTAAAEAAGLILSRSRIAALIAEGAVTGPAATAKRKAAAGDVYRIALPPPVAAEPQPEAIPLTIIHEDADLIVVAPSNPLVSVAPILGAAGPRAAARSARAPVVAVSPLIAGAAVKGPAARMMAGLGHRADALGVARLYADLADRIVIDTADAALAPRIAEAGPRVTRTDILMHDAADKARLARAIVNAARPGMERAA